LYVKFYQDNGDVFICWVASCGAKTPNTAFTRSPAKYAGAMVVGLPLRGVRVFKHFPWLGVGSVKVTFSRPAHQRVTPAVGRLSFPTIRSLKPASVAARSGRPR